MQVGIVGATGAVGLELVQVLKDRRFPVTPDTLHLFASERSKGKQIDTAFGALEVEEFSLEAARKMDILFLAVSGSFAKEYARALAAPGGPFLVVDNSSALRLEPDVPLVVPEINGDDMRGSALVANPNCTTAIAVMALWPVHVQYGLRSVVVSSYQAASGAGTEGIVELQEQTRAVLEGKEAQNSVFAPPAGLQPHSAH